MSSGLTQNIQGIRIMSPPTPMMRNMICQLKVVIRYPAKGRPIAGPSFVPVM